MQPTLAGGAAMVLRLANTGRSACWPWHLLRADGGAPLGLREVLSSEASPGYLAGGVILGACWRARAMLVIAVSAIAAMPISAAVV
jgi:hypothetical protein